MAASNDYNESARFYCHTCELEVKPVMPEFTCPTCTDGFIEQIEDDDDNTQELDSQSQELMDVSEGGGLRTVSSGNDSFTVLRPIHRGGRRTHIAIHRMQPGNMPGNAFQTFINQLMQSLTGGLQNAPVNIQVTPMVFNGNTGDFVFTPGGLDNIITMLLNQLDGAGPPPAPKDQIDNLPTVVIVQEQVDSNLQCHICMEDFQLDETVRVLPCKHVFHGDCIIPWLELHGTCPICRKTIDVKPDPDSSPPLTNTDSAALA